MNSAIATKTDSTRPDASTMNIPPRFWIPMGPVSRRSSSKQLLPLHHFSFSMWRRPSSKMLRIAMEILSLYGDPEKQHKAYFTLEETPAGFCDNKVHKHVVAYCLTRSLKKNLCCLKSNSSPSSFKKQHIIYEKAEFFITWASGVFSGHSQVLPRGVPMP